MSFESKPITKEIIDVYNKLSFSCKNAMSKQRPGWSYRGHIQNGLIFLTYKEWEEESYRRNAIYNQSYGLGESYLHQNISSIRQEDIDNIDNWLYCDKKHGKVYYKTRLNHPNHAAFISNNTKWLLDSSKDNLEKAELQLTEVVFDKDSDIKSIKFICEDTIFCGEGSTLYVAALDLFGKTHNEKHSIKRPSLSEFTADNINISERINGEATLEVGSKNNISSLIRDFNLLSNYSYPISKRERTKIEEKLPENHHYLGRVKLSEGDFHLVEINRFRSMYY